jgi:hypothetical protein
VHDLRDLQRRVDNLAWVIKNLKTELAIGQYACPQCMARPGVSCMLWDRVKGVTWVDVHEMRLELWARSD